MAFGLSAGAIAMAGVSLAGSAMQAGAAKDAAKLQAGATRDANALQEKQYEQVREDLAPYRDYGSAAVNELMRRMGIGGGGAGGVGGGYAAIDRNAIRQQLLPQFTGQGPTWYEPQVGENGSGRYEMQGGPAAIDEAGLNAAVDARMRQMQAQQMQGGGAGDSTYGSLLKDFTGADLANEPGYQFGLKEGMTALDRRLQAGGSYFSGAALKGAQRFGQDYADTKFGEAFNRDSANKTRVYNFLSGGVGVGQNAAAQTGNAGQTMAGQVGANTTAGGNAAGAARIAEGNAWGGGLQGAVDGYQRNELMNKILGGNTGFGGGGENWRTTGNGMP